MERLLGEDAELARKPHLDITSRAFQSKKFIKSALAAVSHGTFEGRLVDEVGAAEQDTGEALKQLIRDNLGTFIESKDAMDAVFTTDHELFTGEALEDITLAFAEAQAGCEGLVKPIMDSYLNVQHSRQSHDILEKLFSVLSVPGTLYNNCGVRVVLSRSALQIARKSRKRAAAARAKAGKQKGRGGDGHERDEDVDTNGDEDIEAEDDLSDAELDKEEEEAGDMGWTEGPDGLGGDGDNGGGAGAAFAARGALEDLTTAAAGGAGSDFMLEPGEELFFWYGTPLARLRDDDAQRLFEETVSNHEGAVLCLRRAMLYMEENYNLEDGTLLVAEVVEDGEDAVGGGNGGGAADTLAAAAVNVAAKARKVSAVHRSPFMYKFSLALLRAALYLVDQLSEELERANAADTVLIEDTLSMMMDVSIATVKLWKFCAVLQADLRQRSSNENALDSLRDKLAEGVETAAAAAAAAGGEPTSAGPSFAQNGDGTPSASIANPSFTSAFSGSHHASGGMTPASPQQQQTRRRYHPAQYFISSTRSMHARLTRASAAALLQEASEWRKKVALSRSSEAERQQARDLAAREDEGTTEFTYGGGGSTEGDDNASLQFTGGMLGNFADSFVANSDFFLRGGGARDGKAAEGGSRQDGGGAASPVSAVHKDELSSMSFTADALRVGGFGNSLSSPTRQQQQRVAEVETHAASILHAFRTPEEHFDTFTTFSIGSMDMSDILEGSCTQIMMHSKAMLTQLADRSDTEAAIMAESALLMTFAARLSEACVANLEHVIVSYWGGIATTIHGGVFDFTPDPTTPLGRMLAELLSRSNRKGTGGAGGAGAHPTPQSPSLSSSQEEALPQPGGDGIIMDGRGGRVGGGGHPNSRAHEGGNGAAVGGAPSAAAVGGGTSLDVLPDVKFIPILPPGLEVDVGGGGGGAGGLASPPQTPRATRPPSFDAAAAASLSSPAPGATATTLRDLSVHAVRRMTRSASDVMRSLFLAFVNRAVLSGFVRAMSRYTQGDLLTHASDEQIELHAAILVEVIMGQWERVMSQVSEAVLRIKVVIGESCSTATVTSNDHVREAGELLAELEQLRTACFHCYTHGIGMLAKAYVTLLPMLQFAGGHTTTSLEHRVRARLSRDFASSPLPSKLLNLLSVVLDRTMPFVRRFAEVYDSADLFAAKAEDIGPDVDAAGQSLAAKTPSTARRSLRRRRDTATPATAASRNGEVGGSHIEADPVTQFVASAHAKLVLEHIEEHEELLQALVSNILQTFVDMLHTKAQRVSSNGGGGGGGQIADGGTDEQERGIVECMADALSVPTTVAPLLLCHLLSPCVFELVARQHTLVPAQVASLVQERAVNFEKTYLSRVGEHCQLAVDVMVSLYLAIPQQYIAREVRENGFATPLFDWQRLSGPAASSVRPYLSNCIVHIARAHETLNWIHQPALGAAVTQRLVAHLATSFVTAITTDINAFEVSTECSVDFLLHGTLLIEAEALTVMGVVNAVVDSVAKNQKAGEVLPELLLAKDALHSVTQSIIQKDNAVSESIGRAMAAAAAAAAADSAAGLPSYTSPSSGAAAMAPSGEKERAAQRERMVATATATLRYMVAAICTHLEDTALMLPSAAAAAASSPLGTQGGSGGSATKALAERLARRKEGYEVRHATATSTRQQQHRRAASSAGKRKKQGDDDAESRRAKASSRRGAAAAADSTAGGAIPPPLPSTPKPQEADEAAPSVSVNIAEALYQSGPAGQQQQQQYEGQAREGGGRGEEGPAAGARGSRRTMRRLRGTVAAAAASEDAPAPPQSAAAAATVAPAGVSAEEVRHEGDGARAYPEPRRARRRVVSGVAPSVTGAAEDGGGGRRERRANRFKRSAAV